MKIKQPGIYRSERMIVEVMGINSLGQAYSQYPGAAGYSWYDAATGESCLSRSRDLIEYLEPAGTERAAVLMQHVAPEYYRERSEWWGTAVPIPHSVRSLELLYAPVQHLMARAA